MDWQEKYKPQSKNSFFEDLRDDRPPVPGAIPRGNALSLKNVFDPQYQYLPALSPSFYSGKDKANQFIKEFPLDVSHELIELGQKKYNIFCINCHGASGDGNGITKKYGMISTASYHDERLINMPIGEIYSTIVSGKGQMNTYADKLNPKERWAVILYIRALQKAQNATLNEVPQKFHAQLKKSLSSETSEDENESTKDKSNENTSKENEKVNHSSKESPQKKDSSMQSNSEKIIQKEKTSPKGDS